jgi:hypothetical protein
VRLCLLFVGLCLATSPAYAKNRIIFPYSPCTPKSTLPGCTIKRFGTETIPYAPKPYADHGLADTLTEQGRHARGIYITPMYLHGKGAERTALAVKHGKLDAVVIDMKDDLGNLTYPSRIPLGQKQINVLIKDPVAMVKTFHAQGIYVIGRIVSFKDSRLPYARPDLAVRTGAHAERLFAAGENWLDAYAPEVSDYLVDIALELQSFGFDEIQFDYIRFPKGRPASRATWLHAGANPPSHADVMAGFLERVDRAVSLPISADVFGLTTLVDGDPCDLGQHIERMAQYIEAISPMMYPNGMDTYFRNGHVTSHVIELIQCGLAARTHKAKDIVLRPYLQGYGEWRRAYVGTGFRHRASASRRARRQRRFPFLESHHAQQVAMQAMHELALPKEQRKGVAFLQRRPDHIDSAWCPATGNVFATPADRDKRSQRTAGGAHKLAASHCTGSCATAP